MNREESRRAASPAFPRPISTHAVPGEGDRVRAAQTGMDTRTWLTGQALANTPQHYSPEQAARRAVSIADHTIRVLQSGVVL